MIGGKKAGIMHFVCVCGC